MTKLFVAVTLLVFVAACSPSSSDGMSGQGVYDVPGVGDSSDPSDGSEEPEVIGSPSSESLHLQCQGDTSIAVILESYTGAGSAIGTLLLPSSCSCSERFGKRILLINEKGIQRLVSVQVGEMDFVVAMDDCYGRGVAFRVRSTGDSLSLVDMGVDIATLNSDYGFFVLNVREQRMMSTGRLDLSASPEEVRAERVLYFYRFSPQGIVPEKKVAIPDSLFQPGWMHYSIVGDPVFRRLYDMGS